MMTIIPSKSVLIGSKKSLTAYQETNVGITFQDISTDILGLMGKVLEGLPITLQATEIHVNNGLLSGKLTLTVIGT
jgi:hypothetical protein